MIRIQLSRMIMGEERRSKNREEKRLRNGGSNKMTNEKPVKKNPATIVANAYRAARWRVSFMYGAIKVLIFTDDW
jgi:hypothetical protein